MMIQAADLLSTTKNPTEDQIRTAMNGHLCRCAPTGWRTAEGVLVGEQIDKVVRLYGTLGWQRCIGYGAMTMRKGNIVTSIYTTGQAVYGFAITASAEPICQ